MKTMIQAFTGGCMTPQNNCDINERLFSYAARVKADTLLIGWDTSLDYREIIEKMHQQDREVYLWLPVFSEYGSDRITAIDYLGEKHQNAISDVADDFTFACPSKVLNIEMAARYYERYFAGYGFDGVFLDKIRFSSFGNGFQSGIGCFCDDCLRYYCQEGIDISAFIEMMNRGNKNFLLPLTRQELTYRFADPLVDELFIARAKLISDAVNRLTKIFRDKGLKIGLDVFAPPFAYLFGQDIKALAEMADFIKPMIYRVTDAPAGIPYEARFLKAELRNHGCLIEDELEILWQTDDLAGIDCFKKQLKILKGLSCEVYSGVEVNKDPICATSLDYVKESLQVMEQVGISGSVLSWNVLAETVYPE